MTPRPASALAALALLAGFAGQATAQGSVAADLWRVAAGTLVVPPALASDGSAALWTPAATLAPGTPSLKVGVETIHAPTETGVAGSVVTGSVRTRAGWTLSAVYGRVTISDLVRTETSPEGLGSIPAFSQVLSVGAARPVGHSGVAVGVAARALSGRLADRFETRWAVDAGAAYVGAHLRLGLTTHFLAPAGVTSAPGASLLAGAEVRSSERTIWGAAGHVAARYGATLTGGESAAHLVSVGLSLGGALELDAGASRESVAGEALWRSRAGAAVTAGRYRVYLGRDGGANGFGATYRFGMAVVFP